jgi:hypothetical protein
LLTTEPNLNTFSRHTFLEDIFLACDFATVWCWC